MCGANKSFFAYLPLFLFFVSAAAAPQAKEAGPAAYMPMYLISEAELQSIETHLGKSETEKRIWLSQVSELRIRAGKLEADSMLLNSQLSAVRERNRTLEQSFNELEADWLTRLSLKNGEIADLKQMVADKTLEAAADKGTARNRLIVIIGLAGTWIIFIAFKICRFFRLF
jgi:hypothetical protein